MNRNYFGCHGINVSNHPMPNINKNMLIDTTMKMSGWMCQKVF